MEEFLENLDTMRWVNFTRHFIIHAVMCCLLCCVIKICLTPSTKAIIYYPTRVFVGSRIRKWKHASKGKTISCICFIFRKPCIEFVPSLITTKYNMRTSVGIIMKCIMYTVVLFILHVYAAKNTFWWLSSSVCGSDFC
jgi:hypothetical protein